MSEDFERDLAAAFAQHLKARPRVMYCPRHPIEAYTPQQLKRAGAVASRLRSRAFVLLEDPDDG